MRTALALLLLLTTTSFGMTAETPEQRQACGKDANEYCADEIPDKEQVYACLVKHVQKLSGPCQKIIRESMAPAQRRR